MSRQLGKTLNRFHNVRFLANIRKMIEKIMIITRKITSIM
jgi:hypothetical protein